MAPKPLTDEAIALTEKKMDMALDDIIKMSKNNSLKPKKQRVSNRGQKFVANATQDRSVKGRNFMDTRSSLRQEALARRRSNIQGNQFPASSEAAKKASVAPIRNRNFNQSRTFNVNKPRTGASTAKGCCKRKRWLHCEETSSTSQYNAQAEDSDIRLSVC